MISLKNILKTSAGIKISFIIYLLLISFISLYVYDLNTIYSSSYLFWIPILIIYSILFIQLLIFPDLKSGTIVVLTELVLLNIVLHGLFQFPFSIFYGDDPHYDLNALENILISGHIIPSNINGNVSLWPLIHIYGAIVSGIINLNLYGAVKISPLLIELSLPITLYILFKKVVVKESVATKVSLFSVLFFITIFNHIEFGSEFVRQTIAISLLIIAIIFFNKIINGNNKICIWIIGFILVAELTLAHHFSSLIYIILIIVVGVYNLIVKHNPKFKYSLIIISTIIVLGYWIYFAIFPLLSITSVINNIILQEQMSYLSKSSISIGSLITTRSLIVFYGFFVFNIIFSIILITYYKRLVKLYDYVLFLFICGGIGAMSLFFSILAIYPDRLLTFGWLFGGLPLIYSIYMINNKIIKILSVCIIFTFFVYNIYLINPSQYENPADVITQPTLEDYRIANTIDISNYTSLTYINNKNAFYDIYNKDPGSMMAIREVTDNIHNNSYYYDCIVINDKFDDKIINDPSLYKYHIYTSYFNFIRNNNEYNKIISSNNIEIFLKK